MGIVAPDRSNPGTLAPLGIGVSSPRRNGRASSTPPERVIPTTADAQALVQLLAQGIPAGLMGVGLSDTDLDPALHLCTISAHLASVNFNRKNQLVVAFIVPPEHEYIALPLRDAGPVQMTVRVYGQTNDATVAYGSGAATTASPEQEQRAMGMRTIREKHAIRTLHREMKYWTVPGPVDDCLE